MLLRDKHLVLKITQVIRFNIIGNSILVTPQKLTIEKAKLPILEIPSLKYFKDNDSYLYIKIQMTEEIYKIFLLFTSYEDGKISLYFNERSLAISNTSSGKSIIINYKKSSGDSIIQPKAEQKDINKKIYVSRENWIKLTELINSDKPLAIFIPDKDFTLPIVILVEVKHKYSILCAIEYDSP